MFQEAAKRKIRKVRIGTVQRKILLLLFGGLALGLSGSPRRYFRIFNAMRREWRAINNHALHQAIKRLYRSRLVEEKKNPDGSVTLVLSEAGKKRVLTFKIDEMKIVAPKIWDGKWRVVIFDIPEKKRNLRDILRQRLKQMEFCELQKSAFIHPYPCKNEINFLIETYDIRPYVRQLVVDWLDSELHLKKMFSLL